jgi:hypothetical protein
MNGVTGVVTVWVRNEQGRILEQEQYNGVVTDTGYEVIEEPESKPSPWYILVGTEDRIRYRGKSEPGRVRGLDHGYPEATDGGIMMYRATFGVVGLNARGVNAAVLVKRTQDQTLNVAYARIRPTVRVQTGGTVQIEWEIKAPGNKEQGTKSKEQKEDGERE